ncbi:ABC transporter ATP-binding protein [Clostridia bacterium]|nr:ABC transporter ATP-binding protein [Clostridia bacterium]
MNAAIEVHHYTFRYPCSGNDVLRDCQFTLAYGEFVLLAGDSGSGKSTLIRAIIGSLPDTVREAGLELGEKTGRQTDEQAGERWGRILIDGRDVTEQTVSARARFIGSVLQDADSQIIHTKVEDEIAFGGENLGMDTSRIEEHISRVCALLELECAWNTSTLSGGQKQRLITAAALVMDRKILILDEPLANLDRAGAALLLHTLAQLAKDGYAVLMAEHRIDVAAPFANRIVRLEEGRVCAEEDSSGRTQFDATMETMSTQKTLRPMAPLLSARGLSLQLGGREIFRDVSMQVDRGERIVIVGENGSGKTMLLRTLARLQKPTRGEIVFSRSPQRQYRKPSPAWFRGVGYVFQNPNVQLFMPSVFEEIAYGAKSTDAARHYMELFGLKHLSERHPHSLSEGQKRLLTIAAIAAQEPEILLLDEPTVGQDHMALKQLMVVLGEISKERGMAIIMVTHDRRCAGYPADQIVRMQSDSVITENGVHSG